MSIDWGNQQNDGLNLDQKLMQERSLMQDPTFAQEFNNLPPKQAVDRAIHATPYGPIQKAVASRNDVNSALIQSVMQAQSTATYSGSAAMYQTYQQLGDIQLQQAVQAKNSSALAALNPLDQSLGRVLQAQQAAQQMQRPENVEPEQSQSSSAPSLKRG